MLHIFNKFFLINLKGISQILNTITVKMKFKQNKLLKCKINEI